MFERFTDRARRVVVVAQEEARQLNHNYIGTEHILLALIREGEGVAAKALEAMGISLSAVQGLVIEIIGRGQQTPSGHIPFTPRAKKVLELSLREALQLGHNYIGTEHILLGLIREGEGVAANVLIRIGADLNRVREQVVQQLHGYELRGAGQPPDPAPDPDPVPSAKGPRREREVARSAELMEAIRLAEAEAYELGHGYVGTEHLLLGLLLAREADPDARASLLEPVVTAGMARQTVVAIVGTGSAGLARAEFTPEAGDVLDLAQCRAAESGAQQVAPDDVLVALAWAAGSVASRVLADLGQVMPGSADGAGGAG